MAPGGLRQSTTELMAKPARRNDVEGKRARRRRQVIDAAAAVFAEKGYHGASTRDIAERLRMQQGSLYYYFPSKDAALEEVCRAGVADFVEGLERIVAGPGPAERKIRAAVANHLEPFGERPDYVRTFLFDRHALSREARREVGALSRRYEALLEQLFRDGVASGAFRPDLDGRVATLAFIGACNMAAMRYRPSEKLSLDRMIAGFADLILDGVAVR